jgi:hypothetical protein
MRPSITRVELEDRIDQQLETLRKRGANLSVDTAAQAVDEGVKLLELRGILVSERTRLRVRDRMSLRYYARTIAHLLSPPPARISRAH